MNRTVNDAMNDLDFLENILDKECKRNPLLREVGDVAGNVQVSFITSVETLHAWRDGIKTLRTSGMKG